MGLREWRAMGLGWVVGLIAVAVIGSFTWPVPVAATVTAGVVYAVWQ